MNRIPSLRDYVEALREIGEVVEIDREVDWSLEMGAITRRCYEIGAPAPLFNNVKDAEPGFRAIGASVGASNRPGQRLSRIALSLGLEPRASAREIVDSIAAARTRESIKPMRVQTGPCKQNIRLGDDVDLLKLPLPLLHVGDGGRYLNTLGMIGVRTPDGQWTNWSVARVMVLDERHATGVIVPFQHIGKVYARWVELGQDMPFVIALGVEPLVLMAAGMPLPDEIDEVDYVGGYIGEPVEVVKAETNDLEVPATAEIVLEGTVSVRQTAPEGPMGDYGGYMYPHHPIDFPVYTVNAMTFRDDPIYPFTCAGEPPEEDHTIAGVGAAGEACHMLRDAGIPVTTVWLPFEAADGWMAVMVPPDWGEYEPDPRALCRKIAEIVLATKVGQPVKTFIVCEDDIDPSNLSELVWAIDGRNDRGENGQVVIGQVPGWPMTPYIFPHPEDVPMGWMTTRIVQNCLGPAGTHRPERTAFKHNYPAELREQVLRNWEADGFPSDLESAAAVAVTR
jgi:4-hydroxy-3-polyprenylbenzoate decarboxylase